MKIFSSCFYAIGRNDVAVPNQPELRGVNSADSNSGNHASISTSHHEKSSILHEKLYEVMEFATIGALSLV